MNTKKERVICDTCGYIYARGPMRHPGDADLMCSKKPRGTLRELTAGEVDATGGLCGYITAFAITPQFSLFDEEAS